jgi:hypothetical protein
MAQTTEPGASAEDIARRSEEMAKRQADLGHKATADAAGTARRAGHEAVEGMQRAFDGQLMEAQKEVIDLVYRTMTDQARQNVEFALDLTGARGVDRLMQCQNQYWSDTMARAQRFQSELLSITQHAADERRAAA